MRTRAAMSWATPEARKDFARLPEQLQAIALDWLVQAQRGTASTESCFDRPGEPLDGCVKLRFGQGDEPGTAGPNPPRSSDPRWRLIVEYLPGGQSERLLIWAVGLGHPMREARVPSVYALAGRRRNRRLMEDPQYRKEAKR